MWLLSALLLRNLVFKMQNIVTAVALAEALYSIDPQHSSMLRFSPAAQHRCYANCYLLVTQDIFHSINTAQDYVTQ